MPIVRLLTSLDAQETDCAVQMNKTLTLSYINLFFIFQLTHFPYLQGIDSVVLYYPTFFPILNERSFRQNWLNIMHMQ